MGRLDGRNAIVTGAGQGIGLAVARQLFEEGARVLMADIQEDKVSIAAKTLDQTNVNVSAFAVDVTSAAAVAAMIETAIARFGKLDTLVNVAGGSGTKLIENIEDMTEEIWDQVISTNLRSTFLCCRAAAPHLRRSRDGRILNFATGSLNGFVGKNTAAAKLAYIAAKAGIVGFSNQLAKDLEEDGVAVNVIQPGFVLTEPGARIRERFDAMSIRDREDMLSRMEVPPRTPQEIGFACAFILSHNAKQMTSTVIRVKGKKIENECLHVAHEGDNPLGRLARLEAL